MRGGEGCLSLRMLNGMGCAELAFDSFYLGIHVGVRGAFKSIWDTVDASYGFSSSLPVVLRPSKSSCAWATSFKA